VREAGLPLPSGETCQSKADAKGVIVGALINLFLLNFLLWGCHFFVLLNFLNLPLGWLLSDGLTEGDIESRLGLSDRLRNALGRDLVSLVKPEVFGLGDSLADWRSPDTPMDSRHHQDGAGLAESVGTIRLREKWRTSRSTSPALRGRLKSRHLG
jgi:hypothetical protein